MCGIAGEYQFNGQNIPLFNLGKANDRQQFRGPDGEGIYHQDNIALGHRRLKIFDLSDRAAQPMVDNHLGLALVFNGAIYNFLELRQELEAKGYHFHSSSDTEVLLKAYHAWGKACISRLRGMFAFAIWEQKTGNLILARDRMGIKPLYYAQTANGFKFASTLPALLEFDGIDKTIDKTALHMYLTFHAVPEPLTILQGVRKLLPGSMMTVCPDGRSSQTRYWRLQFNDAKANHHFSEKEWLETTQETLVQAIRHQLAADVPIGILLSGGLDSSLLVALAAEEKGQDIETFSIGFESAKGEQGDEFYYSDLVAKHFGTKHHQMFISNKRLADALGNCVSAMSEPMTSHDNIGFYLLSQEVAKHVKVALSGQGADEIFAGYHWFHSCPVSDMTPEESASFLLRLVADRSYEEYSQLVAPEFQTENEALPFLTSLCAENGSASPVDNLLAYESTFALANGPLGRVDNMTMAASLEARVPFLDELSIDLVSAMPQRFKMPDDGKYMLKQLGKKLLPKIVVDRTKGYFPVPALKHLQGSTLELMQAVLSPANMKRRGLFNPASVQAMLENPSLYLTPTGGSKLWQIGLLEYWLQQQGI